MSKMSALTFEQIQDLAKAAVKKGAKRDSIEYDSLLKEAKLLGKEAVAKLNEIFVLETPANTHPKVLNSGKGVKELLGDLQKYAAQKNLKQMESVTAEIQMRFPESMSDAKERIARGTYFYECKQKAYQLGLKNDTAGLKMLLEEMKRKRTGIFLSNKAQISFEDGRKAAENQGTHLRPQPLEAAESHPLDVAFPIQVPERRKMKFQVHSNFLGDLAPAPSWTILIDETGCCFTKKVNTPGFEDQKKGKCVAILVPEGCSLPELRPEWHAVDCGMDEIQKIVQDLLDHPCGVLGIPVESLTPMNGVLWLSCIEALLDLILRLLPLDGETKLNIFIEEHCEIKPEHSTMLQNICSANLYHLSRCFPERAEKITMKAAFISKDDNSWNGYADAASYLWGCQNERLLKKTGWLGTCFLGTSPLPLRDALDVLGSSAPLVPNEWSKLLMSADEGNEHSLTSALLRLFGEEVQASPELWTRCLDYVQSHLYSKSIHLPLLSLQVRWLKQYQPSECSLTPHLRLVWLSVMLAEANHCGKIDLFPKVWQEFEALCNQLYEEDAPLVCLATLHIAVHCIDAQDFRRAFQVVKRWKNTTVTVLGRQYYGRVLSTYGQLLAFCGWNQEAVGWFQRAIEQFEHLSDPNEGKREILQTRAYKIIAMMDAPQITSEAVREELETYFTMSLSDAADHLAGSDAPGESYAQHILLRFLVSANDTELQKRYLSKRSDWKTGAGHPWELILFYRALLVQDSAEKKTLLRQAYDMALDGGATLKMIACVLLGAIYYDDRSCRAELENLTSEVLQLLPALSSARKTALQNQLETPQPPQLFTQTMLPFNFR